jgi:hypothetical protein
MICMQLSQHISSERLLQPFDERFKLHDGLSPEIYNDETRCKELLSEVQMPINLNS